MALQNALGLACGAGRVDHIQGRVVRCIRRRNWRLPRIPPRQEDALKAGGLQARTVLLHTEDHLNRSVGQNALELLRRHVRVKRDIELPAVEHAEKRDQRIGVAVNQNADCPGLRQTVRNGFSHAGGALTQRTEAVGHSFICDRRLVRKSGSRLFKPRENRIHRHTSTAAWIE